jgi:hypothetical protein
MSQYSLYFVKYLSYREYFRTNNVEIKECYFLDVTVCLLFDHCLPRLLFQPEDGSIIFLQCVGKHLPGYTVLDPRK